jgi:GT2 family glycosyltransferase
MPGGARARSVPSPALRANPVVPASVIVPTLGRPSLEPCLRSVLDCRPGPAEVVVVDQSGGREVDALIRTLADERLRHVVSDGRGIALATNAGVQAASHAVVLVTHDDCTVEEDWVGAAWDAVQEDPGGMVTGRVLPVGDPAAVPSIRTETEPEDLTGRLGKGVLWPANMAVGRTELLAVGGFDERPTLRLAAEDNDLAYRWISGGRRFRYVPAMVVHHHDWRSPQQLRATYAAYAQGQGAFYAKHLRAGDRRVLPFLLSDLGLGVRSLAGAVRYRRPAWQDPRRAFLRHLPVGFVRGWREAGRIRAAAASGPGRRSAPRTADRGARARGA